MKQYNIFKLKGDPDTYGLQIANQSINKRISFSELYPFQQRMVEDNLKLLKEEFNKLDLKKLEKKYRKAHDLIKLVYVSIYKKTVDDDDIFKELIYTSDIIKNEKQFNANDTSHMWIKDELSKLSMKDTSSYKDIFKSNNIHIYIEKGHICLSKKINNKVYIYQVELYYSADKGFYI